MIAFGHCAFCALVYVYARRRIGPLAALLPTVVLLTLGPAWQIFLWPFQIAWLISLPPPSARCWRSTAATGGATPSRRCCSASRSPPPGSASRSRPG